MSGPETTGRTSPELQVFSASRSRRTLRRTLPEGSSGNSATELDLARVLVRPGGILTSLSANGPALRFPTIAQDHERLHD